MLWLDKLRVVDETVQPRSEGLGSKAAKYVLHMGTVPVAKLIQRHSRSRRRHLCFLPLRYATKVRTR